MEWLVAVFAIWGVASLFGLLVFFWLVYSDDDDDLDELIQDRNRRTRLQILGSKEYRPD